MTKITIGHTKIGSDEPTFIIAEAGLNHEGKFSYAKELVKMASKTGADAVKFQVFKAGELINTNSDYYDLFESLELSRDQWFELAEFAEDQGILFTASVFGEEGTDILDEIGVPAYKIASGELTYSQLLKFVGEKNRPIILSTGMGTIGEIDEALTEIYKTGNRNVAILHCVSNYPTEYEETNLLVIKNLKNLFQIPVGFSDHTNGTLIPSIAVALGADIIEKHFTIDKNLPGPDHKLSLEPHEFKNLVNNVRNVEKSLGDGIKHITESETTILDSRRSIYSNENIKENSILQKNMLKIVRPCEGIEPKYLNFLEGKILNKDVSRNSPILWEDIE